MSQKSMTTTSKWRVFLENLVFVAACKAGFHKQSQLEIDLPTQKLFLVPLIGGRWYVITQLAVYTTYIPHIYIYINIADWMIICYLPLTDPPENGALSATVSHALRLCSYGTSAPGWCFARWILNTMEIHEFLAPWNGYTWFVKGNILPAQLFVTNIWLNKNSGKTSPKQCFQVTCATWGGSSISCDQGPHVLGHPKNDLGSAVPVELPKLLSTALVNFSNPDTSKQRRRTTGETEWTHGYPLDNFSWTKNDGSYGFNQLFFNLTLWIF